MRMRLPNDDGYAVHDELSGCPRAHLYSLSKAGGPANPPQPSIPGGLWRPRSQADGGFSRPQPQSGAGPRGAR